LAKEFVPWSMLSTEASALSYVYLAASILIRIFTN